MKILALDLGKFNSFACFFDTATRKPRFVTVATEPHHLATLFKAEAIDLVVMEAWRRANLKRKTDKDDALTQVSRKPMHH